MYGKCVWERILLSAGPYFEKIQLKHAHYILSMTYTSNQVFCMYDISIHSLITKMAGSYIP